MLGVTSGVWSPKLTAHRVSIDGDRTGGFVSEFWGNVHGIVGDGDALVVTGNNRLYSISSIPSRSEPEWVDFRYKKLSLLNRALVFDVDLSGVGCGCNAAVYLVAMPEQPTDTDAAYCDIQGEAADLEGGPRRHTCLEIDLVEGNIKALQSTLHTAQGHGVDGMTCNQDGCSASVGRTKESAHLYGYSPKSHIDSSRPFTVTSTFREAADGGVVFDVGISQSRLQEHPEPRGQQQQQEPEKQADREFHFFNGESVGGSHAPNKTLAPIPEEDRIRTRVAL
jgi:hypothetical protein